MVSRACLRMSKFVPSFLKALVRWNGGKSKRCMNAELNEPILILLLSERGAGPHGGPGSMLYCLISAVCCALHTLPVRRRSRKALHAAASSLHYSLPINNKAILANRRSQIHTIHSHPFPNLALTHHRTPIRPLLRRQRPRDFFERDNDIFR